MAIRRAFPCLPVAVLYIASFRYARSTDESDALRVDTCEEAGLLQTTKNGLATREIGAKVAVSKSAPGPATTASQNLTSARAAPSSVGTASDDIRVSFAFRCHQLVPFSDMRVAFPMYLALSCGVCVLGSCLWEHSGGIDATSKKPWCGQGCCLGFHIALCITFVISTGFSRRLEFIHIPKNAGTAVEMAGRNAGVAWGAAAILLRTRRSMPNGSRCSRYHEPPELFERLHNANPYSHADAFCITRHPYDRAVSEYTYLLGVRWGRKFANVHGTGLYDYPPCSEEGLNENVQRAAALVQAGHYYIDDCHHVPQVDYIWGRTATGEPKKYCTHVLRLEELSVSFDRVMAQYGYPVHLSKEKKNSKSKRCPDISAANLTQETRRVLDEVYREDFLLLNYTPY